MYVIESSLGSISRTRNWIVCVQAERSRMPPSFFLLGVPKSGLRSMFVTTRGVFLAALL